MKKLEKREDKRKRKEEEVEEEVEKRVRFRGEARTQEGYSQVGGGVASGFTDLRYLPLPSRRLRDVCVGQRRPVVDTDLWSVSWFWPGTDSTGGTDLVFFQKYRRSTRTVSLSLFCQKSSILEEKSSETSQTPIIHHTSRVSTHFHLLTIIHPGYLLTFTF